MSIKSTFLMYESWGTLIDNLPNEMAGELQKMINAYAFKGVAIESSNPAITAIFEMIKKKIDEDSEAYEETCKQRSDAGKKGMESRWKKDKSITDDNGVITNDNTVITDDNKAKQSITKITDYGSDNESEYDSDNESENDSASLTETKKKRGTSPRPSLEEVTAYCRERGNNVDPETFIDFYSSNGWKVGKNPMKDWKACVRTWEKRESGRASPSKPQGQSVDDYLMDIINGGET